MCTLPIIVALLVYIYNCCMWSLTLCLLTCSCECPILFPSCNSYIVVVSVFGHSCLLMLIACDILLKGSKLGSLGSVTPIESFSRSPYSKAWIARACRVKLIIDLLLLCPHHGVLTDLSVVFDHFWARNVVHLLVVAHMVRLVSCQFVFNENGSAFGSSILLISGC